MKFAVYVTVTMLSLVVCPLHAGDWPGFRGPNGVATSDEKDLPVEWSKDNILWKLKLPGVGASSPITAGIGGR